MRYDRLLLCFSWSVKCENNITAAAAVVIMAGDINSVRGNAIIRVCVFVLYVTRVGCYRPQIPAVHIIHHTSSRFFCWLMMRTGVREGEEEEEIKKKRKKHFRWQEGGGGGEEEEKREGETIRRTSSVLIVSAVQPQNNTEQYELVRL